MEWLATIFSWFLPDAVSKAEKASADARHSAALSKVRLQLEEGRTLQSCTVSEAGREEASLSFDPEAGYLLRVTGSSQRERCFETMEKLDEYLVADTKFRVGDFLPR